LQLASVAKISNHGRDPRYLSTDHRSHDGTETNVSRQTIHNCKEEDAMRADKNNATQLEITVKWLAMSSFSVVCLLV